MNEIEIASVTAGGTQLLKYYGLSSKLLPLVSISISILLCVLESYTKENSLILAIIKGLAIGISTTGVVGLAGDIVKKTK